MLPAVRQFGFATGRQDSWSGSRRRLARSCTGWRRFRRATDRESGPLQIMYGIDGREELPEEELCHLEGYMGSAPVRIGNRAATQLQLDIYGELMDSVYLCNKYGRPLYHDGWMER